MTHRSNDARCDIAVHRSYVQPQWVFDCINAKSGLPFSFLTHLPSMKPSIAYDYLRLFIATNLPTSLITTHQLLHTTPTPPFTTPTTPPIINSTHHTNNTTHNHITPHHTNNSTLNHTTSPKPPPLLIRPHHQQHHF